MKLKDINLLYVATLLFLLLSSNANILSSNTAAWFITMFLIIVIGLVRRRFEAAEMKSLLIFSVVYVLFVVLRFYLVNELEIDYLGSDLLFLVKYAWLAFIICAILKEETIAYMVKVMTHLSVVSFVFFALQLIAPETMFKIFSAVSVPTGNSLPGYTNFLVFTFTRGFHDYSNSGFVWEPGAFGCFLVLALMFHFFLNRFRFDGTAIILIIANITTFSTTNYLGLFVLFILAYRYRVPKLNIWVLVLLPVLIALVVFVPFLGDKIIDTYKEDMRDLNHLKVLEKFYRHNRMEIPLNRFSSMWHIINSFGDKLILGVSNKYNDTLNKQFTVNISNGIFDFFAKFGIVGFLYLMYRYIRFCRPYVVKIENLVYCALIILALSFGEPILILPFVLVFLFLRIKQNTIDFVDKSKEQERFASI
ncbi:O-antigen ligase family protein [Mucilaginibacter sp.]|uniref:O-antigen ligase family protein n=1 Tax=Mucilaginibacter sp. TaxID=1882438 RepID=UPI0035BBA093